MKLFIFLAIIIHLNLNSAIRYKNRKYFDSHEVNDKHNAASKVDVNQSNKINSQRSNLDTEDAERKKQIEYDLAYQKLKEETAHKKKYTENETKSDEYSSTEHYEYEKIDLETRRANGLEPKGFWSGENDKTIKKSKKAQTKSVHDTKQTVLQEKDHSFIDKLDQKYFKHIDNNFNDFQIRFTIGDNDFVKFKKEELTQSNESEIGNDNKKYIDTIADINKSRIKNTNAIILTDFTTDEENYYKNMKQEKQRKTDRKHYRRKYSREDTSHSREENVEKIIDSQEGTAFGSKEFHGFKPKQQKTRYTASTHKVIRDAMHKRRNSYYHKNRNYITKITHTHRVDKDRKEVTKDTKKQLRNPEKIEHQTKPEDGKTEDGKTEGRHHYRNQSLKKTSIEYTNISHYDGLSENNDKYMPEEENKSNYKPKSRDVDKDNKFKNNQQDAKYSRENIQNRSQINHKKEHLGSHKYPDIVNRRLENSGSHTPKYNRLPSKAMPRRIKSFSVERFEKAHKQTQDQYFEQEMNDYHNPEVLPPQVPQRKLKPIHTPPKIISRANERLHPIKKPREDAVELIKVNKPGESEEDRQGFNKPVVQIKTTTLKQIYRSDSEHLDKRPIDEFINIEKNIQNNKVEEHVTKSRYEQYLQHFHDNNDANNQNHLKNDKNAKNPMSNLNDNGYEHYQQTANNKHSYRNKKQYDNENNNENYNVNNYKMVNKNYTVKKYVTNNDKFENSQEYRNNDNNRNTETINYNVNKNEDVNMKHIKSNDYYDKNINNAPNYGYDNKKYINRDDNSKDKDLKNNYYDKNYFNNNNYKNNDDNANDNNYEENRNSNLKIKYSNYRDKPEKYGERRPTQGYESRPHFENQPEDRYNPSRKPVTPNYQNEMDTRGVGKEYDRQRAIDTNYGNYPENYKTPNINNESPQRSFPGSPKGVTQEPYLGAAQNDPIKKENLRFGPKVRIEEKPGYRIEYMDFRRRYRKKNNISGTKRKLDSRRNIELNIMRKDDSNNTKSKISKDLIRQWRKDGNIENEQKPKRRLKRRRRTSKKTDFSVIGPREIAYLKEKYNTLSRAEQSDSKISINTVETSEQDNHGANSIPKKDNDIATKNDEKIILSNFRRRKEKHGTKIYEKKKTLEKPLVTENVEKDDVLNLTDALIDNKVKENNVTTMTDDLEEMEDMEEKNYRRNFKSNVWSALKKSILARHSENKTDNILLLKTAATSHVPKTDSNVSVIKRQQHNQNNDIDSEINDTADKMVVPTQITEKPTTLWKERYKNLYIQKLQYPENTRKYKHDRNYDDSNNPLMKELKFSYKIRKHGRDTDKRLSNSRAEDNSKNYHNISISKYGNTDNDDENLKSEQRHEKHYNDYNNREHFRHNNKHDDEQDDTDITNDNSGNEKKREHHKSDDYVIVDHYNKNKDRIDYTDKDINYANSKSKFHRNTRNKNDDSDHKTESNEKTHNKPFDNQKIVDTNSIKHEFLNKHRVKYDNIIKKSTEKDVDYVKMKRDHKYTITHSESEHANSEHTIIEHGNGEHSRFRNKIRNDDTHNNTENTEEQNEQIVSTNIKKEYKTDKKIVKHQINTSNNQNDENKKDLPEVRDISVSTRNKSEAVRFRTTNETKFHKSNKGRARSDDDDDCEDDGKTTSPHDTTGYDDLSNSKFNFIVMLVHELNHYCKCICTAVTITLNFALTAAHCIPPEPKPTLSDELLSEAKPTLHIMYENYNNIQRSKHRNKTEPKNKGNLLDTRDFTTVLKIYKHPNYRQVFIKRDPGMDDLHSSTVNDIAILKTQYNLPQPVGKLSAFEFNSLLGVSVNFYGMENNNCTKGALADITLRRGDNKYILRTYSGAVTTCNVKAEGITLCLAPECNQHLGENLNMLEGGPVIFSNRVIGIVNEIEPAITFIPVSPYLDWITQILDQGKPVKVQNKVLP